MSESLPEIGTWIKPFGEIFLGLDDSGIIRRAVGVLGVPELSAAQVEGLSWQDFIAQHAAESALDGLKTIWLAMTERRVAAEHWPPYLPFCSGVKVRLCQVENDPVVSFAAHLSPSRECDLEALIGQHMLEATDRLVRISQRVFRGINGPLTDLQVREVGGILNYAEYLQQTLEDVRAEFLVPATTPPQPHPLNELLSFRERDFPGQRRFVTHQLILDCQWSPAVVYCLVTIRDVVRRVIYALIAGVTSESIIALSDSGESDAPTVQVEIRYHSQEPALRVTEPIEPVALSDPGRFQPTRAIERLVTTAHACLKPVKGRAWAEPCQDVGASARMVLVLPRWHGEVK
jgi:hypothetical protein